MMAYFVNTKQLFFFVLKREKWYAAIWITALVAFSAFVAFGMISQFDEASRLALLETLKNPAMIAMMGPIVGVENFTAGALYSTAMLLWVVMAVAVMNIFLVVRNTRADEEKGRIEMVLSFPTGRLSNLSATLLVALAVNTVLSIGLGLALNLAGDASMNLGSSLLYGAAVGTAGLVFATLSALFSQLFSSSRMAFSFSFLSIGIFYLMRAAGDMGNEFLSYLSPLGLAQRTFTYAENLWWPVLVLLLIGLVISAVAYRLNYIRDVDQGFIHAKPGRKEATSLLRNPHGMTFYLLRGTLITFFIVMFVLGASYGSILGDIETFVAENEFYQNLIGVNDNYTLVMMFASMVSAIMALICIVPLIMAVLKLRGEEKDGRAENILARSVSRPKYLLGFVVLAFAASIIFQCATALGLYSSAMAVLPDTSELSLGFLLQANLVYLPALWIMIGLAVLLIGLWPRFSAYIWAYYGAVFLITFVGRFPEVLPSWLQKISPIGYIPQLPVDEINYLVLFALTLVAAGLTVTGFYFYRKRDMVIE